MLLLAYELNTLSQYQMSSRSGTIWSRRVPSTRPYIWMVALLTTSHSISATYWPLKSALRPSTPASGLVSADAMADSNRRRRMWDALRTAVDDEVAGDKALTMCSSSLTRGEEKASYVLLADSADAGPATSGMRSSWASNRRTRLAWKGSEWSDGEGDRSKGWGAGWNQLTR